MEKTIKVNGIHCGGCEGCAKRAMEALAEVEAAEASHETGIVKVTLKSAVSDDVLKSTLEAAKFEVLEIQ